MSINAGVEDAVPAFDLTELISRFIQLFNEGNEKAAKCPFCDAGGHSFRIGVNGWRCFNCCSEEVEGGDAPGFYACWTSTTREEAIAKLGNGAGLPDAKPIEQVPMRKLPFRGWKALNKQPDKPAWIHELSGSVLVWRKLAPERVHLGIIEGRSWDNLAIVAPPRKIVLVPENNAASRIKMQRLAAALYKAGHKKVMRLELGLDPDYGTLELPAPGEDVIKWALARSKLYPAPGAEQINAAPQGADSAGNSPSSVAPAGAAPLTDDELQQELEQAAFPPEFVSAKIAEIDARVAQRRAQGAQGDTEGTSTPPIAQPGPPRPAAGSGNGSTETLSEPPRTWDGLALILGNKGEIKACEHNAKELMAAAKQYDCLHFDRFLYRVRMGERDWSDADDRDAVCWLQSAHQVAGFTLNQTRTAAMALAHARPHDSLFEFVMGLPEWDGTPRIDRAFTDAWGAPDTALVRAASRNFFIALHARAVKPGSQVDNLWAIEGPQGKLKSASLRALGEHFHAEISAQIGTADFLRELRGIWIAELSELDSLRGREASTVKRLLSAPSDRFVEKYEKHASAYPRRAVAVATTNEATYWQDSTGARRLIPIRIANIRLDLIVANRLQWFAEARHLYQAQCTWWEFPEGMGGEQEERQSTDPWEDSLKSMIEHGRVDYDGYAKPWPEGWISSAEILRDWLRVASAQQGRGSGNRLGHVMRRLGFEPKRSADGSERGWAPIGWRRGEGLEEPPPA
jgi:predicted P-loop ATPase